MKKFKLNKEEHQRKEEPVLINLNRPKTNTIEEKLSQTAMTSTTQNQSQKQAKPSQVRIFN